MAYRIILQPGNHEISVREGETLLSEIMRHGWHAPYSCKQGDCGTCRARLISGQVEYDELPGAFAGQEADSHSVILCVAKPRSDMELEVQGLTDQNLPLPRACPVRVAGLDHLTEDIMSVRLQLAASHKFEFVPGQYVDILLRNGSRRSFSVAMLHPPEGEDGGAQIELHIRKVEGGYFTGHVFDRLKTGDLLRIYGPLGTFFLRNESARPVIMVCGGTGFAPMQAMITKELADGSSRSIHLFCGMKRETDLYMRGWAREKSELNKNFKFIPVLSEPDSNWNGATGWVHDAVMEVCRNLTDCDVYIAGPPDMVAIAKSVFLEKNLPAEHIFTDVFECAVHTR